MGFILEEYPPGIEWSTNSYCLFRWLWSCSGYRNLIAYGSLGTLGGGFTSIEGKSDSVCWHDGSLPQLGIAHFGDSKWQISGGFAEGCV